MKFYPCARKNPKDGTLKYYATAVKVSTFTLPKVAKEISFACTVSIPDIKAVLAALEHVIAAALERGQSVHLGDLGSFRPTLAAKGQDTPEEVKAETIDRVRVRFSPSAALLRNLNNGEVNFHRQSVNTPD